MASISNRKFSNIVFMGTPEFAVPVLKALAGSEFRPCLVITRPDAPTGRGRKTAPPPVRVIAESLNLRCVSPANCNDPAFIDTLREMTPDLVFTAAYGGYLGRQFRLLPRFGCLNLHPSLLPLYRGATPINEALFRGDRQTGLTIYRMVAKMDAGPILYQQCTPIDPDEDYTTLQTRLAILGASVVPPFLRHFEREPLPESPQDETMACETSKITADTLRIDWTRPAADLAGLIKGLALSPGATGRFRGKLLKILRAFPTPATSEHPPGEIVDIVKNKGFIVATGEGALFVTRVQPEGKAPMDSWAYHLGAKLVAGETFEHANRD